MYTLSGISCTLNVNFVIFAGYLQWLQGLMVKQDTGAILFSSVKVIK